MRFAHQEAAPRSAAALGLALALTCVVALLVGGLVQEEHVALSEDSPMADVVDIVVSNKVSDDPNYNNEYDGWLGEQLSRSLDKGGDHLDQMLSALKMESDSQDAASNQLMASVQLPSDSKKKPRAAASSSDAARGKAEKAKSGQEVQKLLKLADDLADKGDAKASELVKNAVRASKDRAVRQSHKKEQDKVNAKSDHHSQQVKDLSNRIKALKQRLKHHSSRIKHHSRRAVHHRYLSSTLRRVREGRSVQHAVKRARALERVTLGGMRADDQRLRDAEVEAKQAMKHHMTRVREHQSRLRKIRYFLNRVRIERETRRDGYDAAGLESRRQQAVQDLRRFLKREYDDEEDEGYDPHGYGDDKKDRKDAKAFDDEHDPYVQGVGDDAYGPDSDEVQNPPWAYAAISGSKPLSPPEGYESNMRRIQNAMSVVTSVGGAAPKTKKQLKSIRARIQYAVRKEVSRRAKYLQKQNLSTKEEEAKMQSSIQRAVIKAVTRSIQNEMKKTNINPNYGKQYVVDEAVKAGNRAMVAARAAGKSDEAVKASAVDAARHASEVATRQVAKAAARAAALRAAQIAANHGKGAYEQKVAAQVAARTAVKRLVPDGSKVRYLNQKTKEVIAGSRGARRGRGINADARNLQQAADAVHAGAAGFPKDLESPVYDASQVLVEDGARKGKSQEAGQVPPKTTEAAKKADTVEKDAKKDEKTKPATQEEDPLSQKVQLQAAIIRARAASKRAAAAAQAAAMAPPGKAGAKIIAQAKLVAAEAARDVADARMKAELVKIGQGPKPIVHAAASQAVKLAVPIATEVAAQSAALKATVRAVAAAKKMMSQKGKEAVMAAHAADDVVTAADDDLKQAVSAKINDAVGGAVAKAVADAKGGDTEAIIAAARTSAAEAARKVERDLLKNSVTEAGKKAGKDAAAAAQKAGGDAEQIDSVKTQASNTVRLDGEEAVREGVDAAERKAVLTAGKEGAKQTQKTAKVVAKAKEAAKEDVDKAIKDLASGKKGAAKAALKNSQEALSHAAKEKEKQKTSTTTATKTVELEETEGPASDSLIQEILGWI